MTAQDLRTRWNRANPLVADSIVAVALAAFGMLQIEGFVRLYRMLGPLAGAVAPRGDAGVFRFPAERPDLGVWPYVVVALAFLPLALRRKYPVAVLAVTTVAMLVYYMQTWPPNFIVFGPMVALATVAMETPRSRIVYYVVVMGGLVVTGFALAFSETVWLVQALATVALLAGAALFGDAMRSRREYVAEVEQRALEAERTREEEALRRVDEERIRIAREVHDIVAHGLSVVTVQAGAGLSTLEDDPEQTRQSLEAIRDTGKDALAELRSMLDVLRTGSDDAPRQPSAGFADIEELAGTARDAGFDVEVRIGGDTEHLPEFIGLSTYRIVQEALTNVMRHSRAENVSVSVFAGSSDLVVEVADDGVGGPAAVEAGHGIDGMRERAAALGGMLSAGPRDEGGYLVKATIPLPRRT